MAGCSERVSLGCKLERGSCTRCTSHQPAGLFIYRNTHKYKYTQIQIQKFKSKQMLKKEHKVHQPSARGAFHKYKYSWIKIHKYTNRQILSCLTIAETEDDQNISATHLGFEKYFIKWVRLRFMEKMLFIFLHQCWELSQWVILQAHYLCTEVGLHNQIKQSVLSNIWLYFLFFWGSVH